MINIYNDGGSGKKNHGGGGRKLEHGGGGRSMGQGGKAPAPTRYYKRPEFNRDAERLAQEVDRIKPQFEKMQDNARKQRSAALELRTKAEAYKKKLDLLDGRMTSDTGKQMYADLQQEYLGTYSKSQIAQFQSQRADTEMEPIRREYERRSNAFDSYIQQQKEAYNKWRSTIREPGIVRAEIDSVDDQLKKLTRRRSGLQNMNMQMASSVGYTGSIAAWNNADPQKQIDSNMAQLQQLNRQIAQLTKSKALLDEEAQWGEYYQYEDLRENPDFAQRSRYNGQFAGPGNPDMLLYQYINTTKDPQQSASAYAPMKSNNIDRFNRITDEEAALYNYIYATQGADRARGYINYLKTDLNKRQRDIREAQARKFAQEHPVKASVKSLMESPMRGAGRIGQVVDFLNDGKMDANASYNHYSFTNNAIRDQVSQNIRNGGKWGEVGSYTYMLGMSMGDFLINAGIGAGVGAAAGAPGLGRALTLGIMDTGAAADTTMQAKDRGLSDRQAFILGTIAGLAEVFTEKFSLDALLDADLAKDALKRYIAKNMIVEGTEEAASDVINLVADIVISKDKSEWKQSIEEYKRQGNSEGKAVGLAMADQAVRIGLDALGGAISGGIMSGVNGGRVKLFERFSGGIEQLDGEAKAMTNPLETGHFPTVDEEVKQRKILNAKTVTEKSGYQFDVAEDNIQIAVRLSKLIGKEIFFYDEAATEKGVRNGFYNPEEDRIYINAQSQNPTAQIIGHELTHSTEMADVYDSLSNLVMDRIQRTGGDLEAMRKETARLYDANGHKLDAAEVDQEIVAQYVEKHLLTDEKAIMEMANRNRTVVQAIKEWFDHLLAKLGSKNAQEREFITNARDIYAKALQEADSMRHAERLEQDKRAAYAEGNDDYGDQLFDDQWNQPGYVEGLLEKNSFADSGAFGTDLKALETAKQMQSQGIDNETIRKRTGWYAGMDGKWRWEISKANMKYHRGGDAQFRTDRPEYARYKYSYTGINKDGIEVYETSKGIQKLPYKDRINVFKGIMENQYRGKTAKLYRNGHAYYALFDSSDVNKNIYGDKRSDKKGWKAKINVGADGDIFELVENAQYDGSRAETGKKIATHKNVGYWDYFIKTVQIDNLVYDLVANVRKKPDNSFVYSIQLNENKKTVASPSLGFKSESFNRMLNATNNRLAQEDGVVKSKFSIDESKAEADGKLHIELPKVDDGETDLSKKLPVKAADYVARTQRTLLAKISDTMSVPHKAGKEKLMPVIRKITNEYLRNGTISDEIRNDLFEEAYAASVEVDTEFYDQYKEVKDHLRTTAVTISEQDQADIADYQDFRKQAFGTLRIVKSGGIPVDSFWAHLQDLAPGLFPDSITHPADQLQHMYEVGKRIRRTEQTLDEYYGPEAQMYKKYAQNEFDAALSDAIVSMRDVLRYMEDRTKLEDVETELTQEEVTALYPVLKETRRTYEKASARNLLTEEDLKKVSMLLRGDIQPEHLSQEKDNVKGIMAVYEAKAEYEAVAKKIRSWNRVQKAKRMAEADQITKTANLWNDKSKGILYQRETMERNVLDIIKDKLVAMKVIDTYFKPVHDGQAAATRMKNQYRNRIRELNISRKVAPGNHVSEAYAVQFMGEAADNILMMQNSKGRIKYRDGKSMDDWKGAVKDLWQENPNLDRKKIYDAVNQFRKIYDELFEQMNEVRIRNGYEPVNYRRGYFPHFQKEGRDGVMALFGKALGIDTEVTALPTTINGLTHTFKPGIRWFGNALERQGFETTYDAVEGFDKYIEGVADVIHHTDNIQKLRALASQIRYRTSEPGIKKQVDEVRAREDLSDTDKELRIKEIYEKGKFELSNFVVELDEYTNLLANKRSRADRNMEKNIGRNAYNLVKALESRVAANMVAINPGSWLTNFIPLTQGWAALDTKHLMNGMLDTLKAYKTDDGMVDMSSFLTNRRGSDPIVKTWKQDASQALSKPMEWIDNFTSDTLIRARYQQNIDRGLSEAESISEADRWVAGVMADRSKGSMPTMFEHRNPLAKLFTQFQLEVNNQLGFLFKDLPREMKDKGAAALAMALLKFAVGAWLFNEVYEYAIGRRPALDPIGILNDTVGDATGYKLPNLVELGVGAVKGELPSFQTEKKRPDKTITNLGKNVVEELPFIGGVIGGGRLPINSAVPNAGKLFEAAGNTEWSAKKKLQRQLKN